MEFLVALFGISAVPWAVPLVRQGRLMHAATVVLVAGVLFGPSFFAVEAGVQLSIDRVLLLGLAGLIAVRWRVGEFSLRSFARTDWLLIGLVVWLFVRAIPAENIFGGTPPTSRWLAFVAMPAAMYIVARVVPMTDRDVGRFVNVVIGLGLYLAVTAVLEVTGMHAFVFPRYIVDPAEWEFFGRGRGPLLNPVGNGIVLTAALTAAVCRFMQVGQRGKVGYLVAILLLGVGLAATLTRSVWIGAFLALAIAALVYLPRWVRVLGLAASVLLAGFMLVGLKDELMNLNRDNDLSAADAAKSVQLRPLLAIVAWEMFQDRPLIGHGYGGYLVSARPYHTVREYGLPLEMVRPYIQHNVFLSVLVESGLIGLLPLVVWGTIVAATAWSLIRRRSVPADSASRSPGGSDSTGNDTALGLFALGLLAGYIGNGTFHDVSVIPMMNAFLFFTGGIVISRRTDLLQTRSSRRRGSDRR